MKKIIWLLIVGIMICFCGCGSNSTIYEYEKTEIDRINFQKAVYSDNKLVLYITGLDEESNVQLYNSDFKELGTCFFDYRSKPDNFKIKFKGNKMIIEGINAKYVSGLVLSNDESQIYIRYIDSNQYALRVENWAWDYGWDTIYEDENYYTAEEKAAQKEREEQNRKRMEEEQRITDEIYKEFEGYYVCPDDESMYVKIYTGDRDVRWIETNKPEYQGTVYETSMWIDNATWNEPDGIYSSPYIKFTAYDCVEREMIMMYSEDKSTLFFEKDGPIFVKKR